MRISRDVAIMVSIVAGLGLVASLIHGWYTVGAVCIVALVGVATFRAPMD